MSLKTKFYNFTAKKDLEKAITHLKGLQSKLLSTKARFAIPFVFEGKGHFKSMACMQNSEEIEKLYDMICGIKPLRIMEIGTAKGGALYLWCQAADPTGTIISLDLPGGEFGGGYPECRIPFYEEFTSRNQKLHLIQADSHSEATFKEAKQRLDNMPLDVLIIDGDHSYEGVKTDFNLYTQMVKPGGLIAIHDILPREDLPEIEVHKFWSELKERYETREIIGSENSGRKIGWGLIKKPA